MRKFGPLSSDDLIIGKECSACRKLFEASDFVTLVPLGPGPDESQRRKCAEGRHYAAVCALIHWECSAECYRPEGSNET